MQGHRDVRQRVAERADGRDYDRPAGTTAEAQQAGRDRPRALHPHDRAPHGGAAEVSPAHDRPEQHPGRPGDQVEERELHGRNPQPGPGPEFGPALGHVTPQGPPHHGIPASGGPCGGHPDQAEREHAHRVGRRVRGHHHARTGQGDQQAAKHGPGDPGRRRGQPVQRVRVAELVARGYLHRERVQGRREERLAGAHQPGQQDEHPERGPPGEHRGGQRGLRGAAERVGGKHDPAAAEPVGDRAGDRHQQHLRHDGGREHVPQAGRIRTAAQHGPGDRHGRHRRAQQGGRVAGVEPAEIPHRQDPSPSPQPFSPHGTGS